MEKILIIFASRRGSTQKAAVIIQEALAAEGKAARCLPVKEVSQEEVMEAQTLILGSSTWGTGDLHEDFWPLERFLKDQDLSGKTGAAFGCGNSGYTSFCWSAEILQNLLKNQGAKILQKYLEIDTISGFDSAQVWPWAAQLALKV